MKILLLLFSLFAIATAVYGGNDFENAVKSAAKLGIEDTLFAKGAVEKVLAAIPPLQKLAVEDAESFGKNADPELREGIAYIRAVSGALQASTQAAILLANNPLKQTNLQTFKAFLDLQGYILPFLQKALENVSEGGAPEEFVKEIQQLIEDVRRDVMVYSTTQGEQLLSGDMSPAQFLSVFSMLTDYLNRLVQLTIGNV